MPKRMTVFASATLAVLACALVLSVNSSSGQPAADNCLAKPNAASPQGSHWYYRVDKVGNRRCWYLGPKDAKPRQAWSPKPQPALNPQPKPAPQLMATASAATPEQLVARAADASATSSALPASAIDGAGEYAAMHPEDDMPLTLPVLTATDLDAAEGLLGWSPKSEPRFVYVAAALALLMIVRKVFRLFAVRRLRRRRLALREQWNEERATRSRGPISEAFAGTVAATRPANSRRKSVAVPRTAEIPRPPADDRDSDHGIQALEAKESLQHLLYGGQRVAA